MTLVNLPASDSFTCSMFITELSLDKEIRFVNPNGSPSRCHLIIGFGFPSARHSSVTWTPESKVWLTGATIIVGTTATKTIDR